MRRFIARRVALAVVTLWAVSVLVFLATVALPGGAADAILGPTATPARVAALTRALHLNRPLLSQYGSWLVATLSGDFGHSLANGEPVLRYLGASMTNSLVLVACATAVSVPLSIWLGLSTARRPGGRWDTFVTLCATVAASLPEFVIGILLIALFALDVVHWLPPSSLGTTDAAPYTNPSAMVLPVLTLTAVVTPYITRNLREAVIETRQTEFVEFALLNGIAPRTVTRRYVLPNAIGPTLQVIAAELAWMAGGIVLVEYVFDYPGIGGQLVYAISNRDIPVVQFLTLLIGAVYVLANLAADVLGVVFEPATRRAKV